jgi:hypothetical protein
MPLLIDTFNVLHVTGVLPPDLAGLDIDGLAGLIAASRFGQEHAWLVCDGTPPAARPRHRERIQCSWAGPGRSADDLVVAFVERSTAPRRLTVVSSDRDLGRRARRRGAKTLSSEEFLSRLAADHRLGRSPAGERARRMAMGPSPRGAVPLDADEVERWLATFGLPDDLRRVAASVPARIADSPPSPPSPIPRPAKDEPAPPRAVPPSRDGDGDFDLARLLGGPVPPRDGPRSARRSRRDRRDRR